MNVRSDRRHYFAFILLFFLVHHRSVRRILGQEVNEVYAFGLKSIVGAAKETQELAALDELIAEDRRAHRLDEQREEVFAF